MTSKDFRNFLLNNYSKDIKDKYAELDEKNTINWVYEAKPYKGVVIKSKQIGKYKERWDKIEKKMNLT